MPTALHQISLITLLNLLLIFIAMFMVGRARSKHGIKAPAIIGNEDFERVFRAHQNTLEQTAMFLPALWLAAHYGNAQHAAWLGYAWVLGRLWYQFAYGSDARKRGAGFMISFLAFVLLFLMAAKGVIVTLMHGGAMHAGMHGG